jgi:hypothetical protein
MAFELAVQSMGVTIDARSGQPQAAFFDAPFCFAHLRFCAAAIRARASGLSVRFFRGDLPCDDARTPARSARACWRREISESTSEISLVVSMPVSVNQFCRIE